MTKTNSRLLGVLRLFLAGLAVGCRYEPDTALTQAAAAGDVDRIRALVAGGRDPNAPDGHGWAALHVAARMGHADTVTALVQLGADPDQIDRSGWTPLMHAIHKGQERTVRALLDSGAQVDARSRDGATALLMAAGYGQAAVVTLLLERGADPYAQSRGVNALWAAAGGGAIADITDGPPLGSCSPATVRILQQRAPDLKLPKGMRTKVLGWLARSECSDLLRRLS